jgi:A/G-specific adenine glycosylase
MLLLSSTTINFLVFATIVTSFVQYSDIILSKNILRFSFLKKFNSSLKMSQKNVIDIESVIQEFKNDLNLKPVSKEVNFDQEYMKEFRSKLIDWYKINRRKMPWRGDDTLIPITPYGIWSSEVMLQQTRVETVINYWNRWMAKYPTISDLARATPDEVNSLWSGLGYYRRAQNLLKGAQYIVENHNGEVPTDKNNLLKVPGIGPYTAGAILSIAYRLPEPLVDGNVMRVFSRIFASPLEIGGNGFSLDKYSWQLAEKLVDQEEASSFNQALMELGATICKPTNPDCGNCPLRHLCKASAMINFKKELISKKSSIPLEYECLPNDISFFPRKKPKKKQKEISLLVNVLTEKRINSCKNCEEYHYLLFKRPEKGLLANQWEFPSLEFQLKGKNQESEVKEELEGDEDDGDDQDEPKDIPQASIDDLLKEHSASLNLLFQQKCQASVVRQGISNQADNNFLAENVSTVYQSEKSITNIPPIVHIFSHERHTMFISIDQIISIPLDSVRASSLSGNVICWKTAAEMKEMGITTGCKKILEKVEHALKKIAPPVKAAFKKRPAPPDTKNIDDVIDLTDKAESASNAFDIMKRASSDSSSKGRKKKKSEPA